MSRLDVKGDQAVKDRKEVHADPLLAVLKGKTPREVKTYLKTRVGTPKQRDELLIALGAAVANILSRDDS